MKRVVGHTKEDVATLPKWARLRIGRLEIEVERQKALALSASSPEKTNVTLVGDYDDGRTAERGLPKDSKIRFRLDKNFVIEVGLRDEGIEVRSLEGYLVIRPAVSNVIYVKAAHR